MKRKKVVKRSTLHSSSDSGRTEKYSASNVDLNKDVPLLVNYCQKGPHSGKYAEKSFSLSIMHISYLVDKERFFVTLLFLYTKANNSVCIYNYYFQ